MARQARDAIRIPDTPAGQAQSVRALPLARFSWLHGAADAVRLNFPAVDADVFLELPFGRVEGVAQRDVEILVRLLVVVIAADDDVLVRYRKIDSDVIEIALVLVTMLRFDRDFATDDVVAELLQFSHFFADLRFHGIGVRKSPKGNL